MSIIWKAGALATVTLAAPLAAQVTPDTMRRVPAATQPSVMPARDTAISPKPDQARGIDAELRMALFDLSTDRALSALSRLEWLRESPTALTGDVAANTLNRREDLLFLLSQSYYQLGMGDLFRAAAKQLMGASAPGRYGGLIRLQLMLDAYRQGEFVLAMEMAQGAGVATDRGLTALISGLAAYHTKNYSVARSSFASAQQAGGPYAPYARYMDALALMQGDTTSAPAALDALKSVAGSSSGEFADQVRLTAAQLAYEMGRYDEAASQAGEINAASGLGAQALLTRAWALFRADKVDGSAAAFGEFATRYPKLPERDEARIMAAQLMLQSGRTEEAARLFTAIADSLGVEVSIVQARANAMTDAARALVTARAAGLMFLSHPAAGKTLALPDATAGDLAALAGVFGDPALPGVAVNTPAPDLVTLAYIEARLDTVSFGLGADFPRRVFFATTSGANQAMYAKSAEALASSDVMVALRRLRLQEQLDAQAMRIATMQRLQQLITEERARLSETEQRLKLGRDSVARVGASIDAIGNRVRNYLRAEAVVTRELATENMRKVDSVRAYLGVGIGTADNNILQLETSTAQYYRQMAEQIEQNADSALKRHPVFALRDSLVSRDQQVVSLASETRSAIDATEQLVASELAALQGGAETERVRAARATLSAAEARRGQAESQLIAIVDTELRARAGQLVAQLRRDNEAATFGAASASFFLATDPGRNRAAGANGTQDNPRGTAATVAERASETTPPSSKPTSPR